MGSFFSIFKSKKKPEHRISSRINSTDFPSAARARKQQQMGSRQKPTEYWSEAQLSGEISPEELAQQLRWQRYNVHPGHNGGKRTRKHTRNSNSTLKRSTLKQNRA